jgi:hypothetical protein
MVGNFQGIADIVIGYEDADVPFPEMADDVLDFVHRNWIDPRERFIQEKEVGIDGQASGDFRTPPFAAAQV